jgi:hypothetical protein
MEEQRKYAILFTATILAARKLSDPDLTAGPTDCGVRSWFRNSVNPRGWDS